MKDYTVKPEDLAKRFNVTPKTVLNWFDKKGLPGIKIDRVVRFNVEDVEEWIRQQNETKDDK